MNEDDMTTRIKEAADNGAVGAFTHCGVGDNWVKDGKGELLLVFAGEEAGGNRRGAPTGGACGKGVGRRPAQGA